MPKTRQSLLAAPQSLDTAVEPRLRAVLTKFITPKSIIAATVAGCLVAAAGVGFIGYQSYAKVQDEARVELERANLTVAAALDDFELRASVLEAEIATAQSTLDGSSGKTLDETTREALSETIDEASVALERAEEEAALLEARVREVNDSFAEMLWWPPHALESAEALLESTQAISSDVVEITEDIMADTQDVLTAQAAWQAEQDRLAAEAAAKAAEEAARKAAERLSKPRSIPSGSTLSPTGGATAPTAPPPPPAPAPVVLGFSIDGYLSGFVSPSQYIVQYVPGLCNGYYVCGRTLVSNGSTPIIQLDSDPAVLEIYSTDVGKYVLVHELAHVRQYWFYGQNVGQMISGSEVYAPETHRGTAAVEYMADCGTISRLGYALGGMRYPYTSSCSADQYGEGSRYW